MKSKFQLLRNLKLVIRPVSFENLFLRLASQSPISMFFPIFQATFVLITVDILYLPFSVGQIQLVHALKVQNSRDVETAYSTSQTFLKLSCKLAFVFPGVDPLAFRHSLPEYTLKLILIFKMLFSSSVRPPIFDLSLVDRKVSFFENSKSIRHIEFPISQIADSRLPLTPKPMPVFFIHFPLSDVIMSIRPITLSISISFASIHLTLIDIQFILIVALTKLVIDPFTLKEVCPCYQYSDAIF